MYKAYVTTLKNLRKHPNADRLQLAECFGNTVCVDMSAAAGEIGIYFPEGGQLSVEFCEQNNLVRKKDENGNNIGGYLDPNKRNITTINLRGEKSDGLFLPISCIVYTGANLDDFNEGDIITVVNGHDICTKYIPRGRVIHSSDKKGNRIKNKIKDREITPYFSEHVDTPQLCFSKDMFKPGEIICLTEKVHGTSSRNANTQVIKYKKTFIDKIFHKQGKKVITYQNIVGSRRTIVKDKNGGYYGDNSFRLRWGEKFNGKLLAGECVFGEIAGFTDSGKPIMGIADNKKVKDKEFIKQYGNTTTFSYGCSPNQEDNKPISDYYIYRMTYTTPEGDVIEYPWELVKLRAEQLGVKVVPELDTFIYTTEEDFYNRINAQINKPSNIDPTHIIEGVVIRSLSSPYFKVAKEKSYNFKVIEGIIKDTSEIPDMEEAEEILVALD